jgi:hypothetical protein
VIKEAVIDKSGRYRYSLIRSWDSNLDRVTFVMLNPSTADANTDDPTIRRCIGFAKSWEYGSLEVVNLFAYRATNPNELKNPAIEPTGSENYEYIKRAALKSRIIVLAWGTKGGLYGRNKDVLRFLDPCNTYCLGVTKEGHPKHPLYVAANCELKRFSVS